MNELLGEVLQLYRASSGLHGDSEEKILEWVALLVRVFFLYVPKLVSPRQGNDPLRTLAARQDADRNSPTDGKCRKVLLSPLSYGQMSG